jgi:hypothetical protein
MAETVGLVQKLKWNAPGGWLFAYLGPDPTSTPLLTVVVGAADPPHVRHAKQGIMRLLEAAQLGGYPVAAVHPDSGSAISEVRIDPLAVCAIGQPIHGDFFAVSGCWLPARLDPRLPNWSSSPAATRSRRSPPEQIDWR